MVDANGRGKVLEFGLAKLTAPREPVAAASDETRTVAMDGPRTEEGAIIGSVPCMSPEQAEGRPVDARSDIFSFGAVLYEMFSGQRAFPGESRITTLAAVVERDPTPLSEVVPGIPLELERLIARCLRKDVSRRSQNMSDLKLALEELRDESESGSLMRPASSVTPAGPAKRRWLWQAIGAAGVLIAALVTWIEQPRSASAPAASQLVRLTPDDGYSYTSPAISPDGKFVVGNTLRGSPPKAARRMDRVPSAGEAMEVRRNHAFHLRLPEVAIDGDKVRCEAAADERPVPRLADARRSGRTASHRLLRSSWPRNCVRAPQTTGSVWLMKLPPAR